MPAKLSSVRLSGIRRSLAVYFKYSVAFQPVRPGNNLFAFPFSSSAVHYSSHHSLLLNKANTSSVVVTNILEINRKFSGLQQMAGNGEVRKRKSSPVNVMGRPSKIYKPDIYPNAAQNGQAPPEEDQYIMELDGDDQMSIPLVAATADTAEWQATIERVVRNVVTLRISC